MPENYSLKVVFSQDALRILADLPRYVVIQKGVDDPSKTGSGQESTIWVAFKPQMNSFLKWQDTYSVYKADGLADIGKVVSPNAVCEAEPQRYLYEYTSAGIFNRVNYNGGMQSTYYAKNSYGKTGIFGLAQSYSVNDSENSAAPVNASTLLNGETADFLARETIKIALSSENQSGKIVRSVWSEALTVNFTDNHEQTVEYNLDTGKFVLIS